MKHKYMYAIKAAALLVVVVFFFHGRPPAGAQQHEPEAYSLPDISHDGLIGTMTHQNDALQQLAVAQDKQADQMTRAFQRISAVETNQMAETTELRIWGSILTVLLSSGVILQVRSKSGSSRELAKKVVEAATRE